MYEHVLRRGRRTVALAVSLAVVAAMVGSVASPASAQSPVTVRVGVTSIWLNGPPFICQTSGICKSYGITVKPVPVASTAAMVAAINSGSMEYGLGSLAATFQAYVKGLGVTLLAPNGGLTSKLGAAAVAVNSPIKTLKDLAGKTFCVSSIGGQSQAQAQYMVEKAGVDPYKLKFTAVPFASMVQALQTGRCDFADLEAPYLSGALASKQVRVIGDENAIFGPAGSPVTAYFGSAAWVNKNQATTKKFVDAMMATHRYIAKHPNALIQALPKFTGVTPEQAKSTPVGVFPTTFDTKLLQSVMSRFVHYSLVSQRFDISKILWKGAPVVEKKKK